MALVKVRVVVLVLCRIIYVVNELREIKVVDEHNKESVVDLLQSVVEIVTYGDKQDPMIFDNDYINNIIEHQYQFNRGDLAQYYVSFLSITFA
ncbi:hypothetical protein F8388_023881 [Cannabis sativa]|uniref:FPL domain-containing protein n=1 Tax=Cannabis sativa TaxID=3483 RepID=A0A7J6EWI5_CANSA|nr:hypothetical protein F8388_023881 [Cannabis sativa]